MNGRPTRTIAVATLRDFMERLLVAAGASAENARDCAGVFLEADLRGITLQGLDHMSSMLRSLRNGKIVGAARPAIVRETAATVLVDGNRGPGQVAGMFACDLAVKKARQAGASAVAVRNSSDAFMVGYYVDRIARAGMIGFIFSDAPPLVRPHGGVERILGTNPLAVGIPTGGPNPMVFDMATSARSASRVRQAAYHGEDIPEAEGVDSKGRFAVKAVDVRAGAIGPLAGAKGFGLGMIVALFSGPLTGSACGTALKPWFDPKPGHLPGKGHLFIALDPAAFGDAQDFRMNVGAYLDRLRHSRKAPGASEIRVPGVRAGQTRERSLREGRVTLYEAIWDNIKKVAHDLNVTVPA